MNEKRQKKRRKNRKHFLLNIRYVCVVVFECVHVCESKRFILLSLFSAQYCLQWINFLFSLIYFLSLSLPPPTPSSFFSLYISLSFVWLIFQNCKSSGEKSFLRNHSLLLGNVKLQKKCRFVHSYTAAAAAAAISHYFFIAFNICANCKFIFYVSMCVLFENCFIGVCLSKINGPVKSHTAQK